jgi:hypothetical protein
VIYAVIIGSEIAFWILLLAGFTARYLLKRPRLGAGLLAATPLVDLVLLTAAVIDIRGGAAADMRHALAAIYLGISLAFGHRIIAWADAQFAYRFAGAPKPLPGPKYGAAHARHERSIWYRHVLAWVIAAAVLGFIHLVGGNRDETEKLFGVLGTWLIIVGIDGIWSLSYTFSPKRPPAEAASEITDITATPRPDARPAAPHPSTSCR